MRRKPSPDPAPGGPAELPRRGDAVAGPLGDEPTLEMGDRAEHMEHELAGGRGSVEAFLETHEVDALGLEGVDGLEEFTQRAAEPVEADDA